MEFEVIFSVKTEPVVHYLIPDLVFKMDIKQTLRTLAQ